MQGNLREFNIRSILQFIELEQHTGTLYIEYKTCFNPPSLKSDFLDLPPYSIDLLGKNGNINKFLLLYFVDGKITYATNCYYDQLLRIYDYLRYFCSQSCCEHLLEKSVDITSPKEYGYIWELIQQKLISPKQALFIIKNLIKETFWELASLTQGKFFFRRDYPITPQWTGLSTSVLVPEIFSQLRLWKQFFPYIQSPHQYLMVSDVKKLGEGVSSKTYKTLSNWAEKKLSLLRLSRQLNYSLVDLAKALYPYTQNGSIKLIDNQKPKKDNLVLAKKLGQTHIVYIADDMTLNSKVEYILKHKGYNSTVITPSTETITTILSIKPDLIICDWDMLSLDGYEICSMLQNSPTLRQIPLVAISEQEDYLTRLRVKILSLADYLSKPFTQNELLMIVERSLKIAGKDNSHSLQDNILQQKV